uniref:Uncharacterized protein n=1 Tax=Molossus molossus TaxID=27622 RepID=A0A7J8JWQ4_MOLMO|nr:hypothetical protein HJG59_008133 [Molossus molossus]
MAHRAPRPPRMGPLCRVSPILEEWDSPSWSCLGTVSRAQPMWPTALWVGCQGLRATATNGQRLVGSSCGDLGCGVWGTQQNWGGPWLQVMMMPPRRLLRGKVKGGTTAPGWDPNPKPISEELGLEATCPLCDVLGCPHSSNNTQPPYLSFHWPVLP